MDEDEVDRPVPDHLEGDPDVTAARVRDIPDRGWTRRLGCRRGCRGGCRRLCGQLERGVLLKDLPLELAQRRGRLDSELVGELAPEDLVAGERFGVPAGAVQGEHVLGAKTLAQWVLAAQRL